MQQRVKNLEDMLVELTTSINALVVTNDALMERVAILEPAPPPPQTAATPPSSVTSYVDVAGVKSVD